MESQPVQQQLVFAPGVFGAAPADIVKTHCDARINPSRKTTAVFTGRNNMASTWSHRTTNPYASWQNPEREGNTSSHLFRGLEKRVFRRKPITPKDGSVGSVLERAAGEHFLTHDGSSLGRTSLHHLLSGSAVSVCPLTGFREVRLTRQQFSRHVAACTLAGAAVQSPPALSRRQARPFTAELAPAGVSSHQSLLSLLGPTTYCRGGILTRSRIQERRLHQKKSEPAQEGQEGMRKTSVVSRK